MLLEQLDEFRQLHGGLVELGDEPVEGFVGEEEFLVLLTTRLAEVTVSRTNAVAVESSRSAA